MGTVCRDVQHTVKGKILKVRICCFSCVCIQVFCSHDGFSNLLACFLQIRALTELCLFAEAVKDAVELTRGTGVLLPHGQYIASACVQVRAFCF